MRIFEILDRVTLTMLGATAATAGQYGAAQNISLILNISALAFSPLLLSTLSSLLAGSRLIEGQQISRNAMRAVICLLPLAMLVSGSAKEIVVLVFGSAFDEAAPILAFLMLSGIALLFLSVTTSILTAASKPEWTFALAGPMIPMSAAAYIVVIPIHGAAGAAAANAAVAVVFGVLSMLAVKYFLGVLPPFFTFARSILLSVVIYAAALLWPATGLLLLVKLGVLSFATVLGFIILREFRLTDISFKKGSAGIEPIGRRS
jgi:O-antigen/teichoic acid export membrane protein